MPSTAWSSREVVPVVIRDRDIPGGMRARTGADHPWSTPVRERLRDDAQFTAK